ncbi:MAG TPA: TetR/AcrR family transcriptional regulator [Gammaproteobacteria bacterium]
MGTKGSVNRRRIVEAADQLFYSRGYNQTSFSDISDETGIPRGNFYYYFKTKEDILAAVMDQRLDEFQQVLSACEQSSEQPLQRLLCLLHFPLQKQDEVLHYGCPIGTLSAELAKQQQVDISRARLTAVFDLMKHWIEQQLVEMGQAPRASDIAMNLLAKMQGVIMIANVYNDAAFLQKGIDEIQHWLQQSLAN